MNRNSNSYTIIYSIIMVVVVASVLAFTAINLKSRQEENVTIEKMGAILTSIGQAKGANEAPDKQTYISDEFKKFITRTFFVDSMGRITEAEPTVVLGALSNLPKVFDSKTAMPVFEAKLPNDSTLFVVPMTGKGLWGPVWGYVALNADCNTIFGASFDHKSETPGLGAEIALPAFSNQFVGKRLFEEGQFKSINLTKGVGSSADNFHAVDAISGGTLTSNGVKKMLLSCLGDYVAFFESVQKAVPAAVLQPSVTIDSLVPATDTTVVTLN